MDVSGARYNRRSFLAACGAAGIASFAALPARSGRPNIVLCMADDMGWGDTGYNGHPAIKTPHLDDMAARGIRFDRFYSGAPVCSPTRGACLTGRHPSRYGVFGANVGHMVDGEVTLAEALRPLGYATGHFGKWHLGTLTTKRRDSNRGAPGNHEHYSPPWENGFDVCFSTEAKVPTWNPMVTPDPSAGGVRDGQTPGGHFGTFYWTGPETAATDNLDGDDSRVIMDRAVPFIRRAAGRSAPFFAVIWFHAPHLPTLAGPERRALYGGFSEDCRHYYGCISALDEQVGRLRKELRDLGVHENTMLWFASDNGPEGPEPRGRTQGSAGPFRGRKRDLFEGGVRVPGLLEWPDRIARPHATGIPCCTLDYFPTIMDALGFTPPGRPEPLDGVSLMPLIEGRMKERPAPICFEFRNRLSVTGNRYKLISVNSGETFELFDIVNDPGETRDLSKKEPGVAARMRTVLDEWRASCAASLAGRDYRKEGR